MAPPTTLPSKTAIVVLPFADLSARKDQEYFSDGLTEELINVLAKNPKLRVTSRTSAFSFKGKGLDVKAIAEKLGVTHVVEGSVRKANDAVRITAQLIEVGSDSHVWSQTYDRKVGNILTVQDEISAAVAGALKVTLEGGQAPRAPESTEKAYNAYLQGRYFEGRRTRADLEKAAGYFEQALRIDPRYARAWVGLSAVHRGQADWGYVPLAEGYRKARKEAEKALELDPNMAEAHVRMGWIKRSYDWDWAGADASFRRALELEPGNADVVSGASRLFGTLGRFDEAIALDRRAIELDPLRAAAYVNLGLDSFYAGRFADAEAACRKALDLNPQFPGVRTVLGRIALAQSKPEEALAEMQKEAEPIWRGYGLALAYHAAGKKREAEAALAGYIEKYQNEWAFQIAEICAYRGETDQAFTWLERAYKQRDGGVPTLKGDPLLRSLQRDPRWPAFLKTMKLPPD
jgi:TolB-like protein/cytochrome c-type biogenesis protein CcmH/NrfG